LTKAHTIRHKSLSTSVFSLTYCRCVTLVNPTHRCIMEFTAQSQSLQTFDDKYLYLPTPIQARDKISTN